MLRMKLSKLVPSIDDIRYHVRIIASFLSLVTRMLLRPGDINASGESAGSVAWASSGSSAMEALEKAVQMT